MGKLKKFIMNKIEKVNVQVSMLTCGLIIFSCLVIYLVTSGVMISMLADAYNERANLTFTTIESHFDSRLFTEDVNTVIQRLGCTTKEETNITLNIGQTTIPKQDVWRRSKCR